MLCYQGLTDPNMYKLWKATLESGYILQLCRDEVLHIHSFVTGFFESLRRYQLVKMMMVSWSIHTHSNNSKTLTLACQ